VTDWRLLLTRPADDSATLAACLAEHGVYTSSLPLLAIEPLEETAEQRALVLDLDRFAAVVAVSRPAARLALERVDRYWPQPPLEQRWFSVGAATGRILVDRGLDVVWPEAGEDSEALLALPDWQPIFDRPQPRVLVLRGEGGRPWLAEQLQARGATVDALVLYRRTLPDYPPGLLAERVQAERLNGLVVSSGQGFEHLRRLAGDAWTALSRLPLFVPSERVAEQARAGGARTAVDCRGAHAAALLAALQSQRALMQRMDT
jgi:uroporphyrinogen-III synthase